VKGLVFAACLALSGCFSLPRVDDGLVRKDGEPRREVPWFASKEVMMVCSLSTFGYTLAAMKEGAIWTGSTVWPFVVVTGLLWYLRYAYDEGTDTFSGTVVNAITCANAAGMRKVYRQQKEINGSR
jgi:hypothetical protein